MRRHSIPLTRLLWGGVLVTLGLLLITGRLSPWAILDLLELWPLMIIVPGVVKLGRPETRASGVWFISIGSWLQIMTLGLFGIDWRLGWPILMILVGIAIVAESFLGRSVERESHHAG